MDNTNRVLDDRHVRQTQQVNLDKPNVFYGVHIILRTGIRITARHILHRTIISDGARSNHHTGGMSRRMAHHPFKPAGEIHNLMCLVIGVVKLFKLADAFKRTVYGFVERNKFRNLIS